MSSRRILIVDDDASLRHVTQVQLEDEGYTVTVAASALEAEAVLAREPQDLVITDLSLPGISGVELLKHIRSEYPDTVVALLTAFGTVETAVQARKLGVYDYITKPVNLASLRIVVARALEHLSLREEVQTLRRALDERSGFQNIVGSSDALAYALDIAARVSQSDVTVLVHGETGTGKELLAHGIHCSSTRKGKPFVTINCGASPKDLLELELFGQVKGAFAGAKTHKTGKFESAEGGTVLLGEIGELPLELQVKLLRLIQEHEIEKVGDTSRIRLDVRIIAATHRNLLAMVAVGGFKENLYYRLNVVPIELRPLRERGEDIPELVEHFFKIARDKQGRPNLKLPIALLPYFSAYLWPGNIRELENLIERLVMLASGDEITFEDLPAALRTHPTAPGTLQAELPARGISLDAVEKELIAQALSRFHGNQTQAARYLDLTRNSLICRMEKYGLRGERDAGDDPHTG